METEQWLRTEQCRERTSCARLMWRVQTVTASAVGRIVALNNRVGFVLQRDGGGDCSEDLLARSSFGSHVGEYERLDEIPLAPSGLVTDHHLRILALPIWTDPDPVMRPARAVGRIVKTRFQRATAIRPCQFNSR